MRVSLWTLAVSATMCGALLGQTRVEFHLLPAVSTGPLSPSWSPDGRSLAFSMRGDIWTIPAEGGEAVALTEGPAYHFEPAFSPDGSSVALTMDIDGNLDIGIVDATGGAVERLTNDPEVDVEPSWSPDGKSLYFVSRRSGSLDIYRLGLTTRELTPVVSGPRNEFQPAVSPNGRSLAYVAPVRGRSGSGGIWVMPLPSGEPRLAHYEETSYRVTPSWSPDGSTLTYSSDAAGSNDIAIVPSKGGNRARLTEDPLDEFDVAVSPDGSKIAFVSNREGPTSLFTLSSAGGASSTWKRVNIESRRPRYPTGRVRGVVRKPDGNVVPARVMLTASDGRGYTEDGGFHRMVWSTGIHYQHTNGSFEVEMPAGPAIVEAMRGFEFLPAKVTVDVPTSGVAEVELALSRITDPRASGWYSGDTHTHDLHEGRFGLTQESFFHQLVADDVHIANALIHMDGTKLMGRWDDLTGEEYELSTDEHILRYSQEFRGSFGHVALLGVNEFIMPLIGGASNTPYASDVLKVRHIDSVHEQGGIAGFVHPYNAEVKTPADAATADIPVHVALDKGDFFDVVSIASREMDSANVYYKLLNSGFRIAATGGTDNFSDVWYDPSGGTARTYARVEGALSFDGWLSAVKAGRTFGTSGPLLFLTVEGHEPGDEIRLSAEDSASLRVRVNVASIAPLDTVEVVVNGEIVHTWLPSGDGPNWELETTVNVPESAWIAARATGPPSPYVGDIFPFAQTSPIYVVRDGRHFTSASDARFLLESVDELWRRVQERKSWTNEEQKRAYREGVEGARAAYRRVLLLHPDDDAFQEPAPEQSRIRLRTSEGDIVIELHRDWSPHGVDRFYNLVRYGYYDDTRFFRVREADFAQFGIHGDPEVSQRWRSERIPDDPVVVSNRRGRVAFAMGYEPNDRTTQIFISLKDKAELDDTRFAPIGEVVEGMAVADAIFSGYGESAGGGIRGGKQDPMFEGGNAHLDENFPELDRIVDARMIEGR